MAPDRPLRIGVDGRELIGQPTGVGRYLTRVLQEWTPDRGFPHELTVFAHADPPEALAASNRNIRWHVDRSPRGGTVWEQTRLAGAIARTHADVFFAAGYTAPWRVPCPFVVAIYDVSYFAHPEWFRWREGLRRRWLTRRAAHQAASVVTISEFSASEIVRWTGVSRDRVRLAPPGPPDDVSVSGAARDPLVLYVGSLFARRHVPELLEAFGRVARRVPAARLVIVGPNRASPPLDPRALAARHGIGDRVEWHEYVTDVELHALYSRARVFAFLSDYEGFAMTPMEALAHGVPSVLLDTPVAREVYGDAARLVSLQPDALADAIDALLADEAARAVLLAAGRRRLAALSWRGTASVIQTALEEAAGRR